MILSLLGAGVGAAGKEAVQTVVQQTDHLDHRSMRPAGLLLAVEGGNEEKYQNNQEEKWNHVLAFHLRGADEPNSRHQQWHGQTAIANQWLLLQRQEA